MARITIEDCIGKIHDRFELVALSSQRANDINSGSKMTINNVKGDKATVLALREIAAGYVTVCSLKSQLLKRLRTKNRVDPIDEENPDASLDAVAEDFDYLPSGPDISITEDYSDLDDQVFDDNISDNEQK
jgi:DNA-directed RNA polymerase subunit omega